MTNISMEGLSNVTVSTLEKEVYLQVNEGSTSPITVGTIDIVKHLRHLNPSCVYTLLLGEDTFVDLCKGKWKGGLELLSLVEVVVVEREGAAVASTSKGVDGYKEGGVGATSGAKKVQYHSIQGIASISSTRARAMIKSNDLALIGDYLDAQVLEYIAANNLFRS